MRLLFEIDAKDYDPSWEKRIRPSCRSIIIRDGKIALVHSLLYDYYKFPGGGMEKGEDLLSVLARETREEAGLLIDEGSVREYGYVRRIQKSRFPGYSDETIFVQDNYYYFADVKGTEEQDLNEYENEERFTLEYVDARTAIDTNLKEDHGPKDRNMINRETRVLQMLEEEGYLK